MAMRIWAVVTYDNARVFFEGKSHLDGDLDFGIDTGRRGVAEGNETRPQTDTKVIHGEFSSREVVDRMHADTWWEQFHAASDVSTEAANKMLDGKPVKIIGLLGFDNEHMDNNGTYAELHRRLCVRNSH